MSAALAVGQSPRALVPGSPDDLERLAARCGVLARGLDSAATRLRAVDAGEWVGAAGDAFRDVVDQESDRYRVAAEAFAATGAAVRSYASVLADAQAQAGRAVSAFEDAESATASWQRRVAAYEDATRDRAEEAHTPRGPEPPRPPHHDPGADGRASAASLLDDARERVRVAGDSAARRISAAWADAPREPRWWEDATHVVSEIGAGAWEATVGLAELAWSISPVRMTVDPVGWQRDVTALGEGLAYGVTHPVEFGKAILDWDTWAESPGRAIGHLVPDLLLTLATAGAGAAARGARAASAADEMADMATTLQRLDRLEDTAARQGYLARARELLRGRESPMPPPNLPPGSPAAQAAASQGKGAYPGVDDWWSARMRPGDEVAAGSVSTLQDLPFSGFAVPRSVADDVGGNARELFEGVQVQPYHGSYRDEVTVLRARSDVDVAVGTARNNPQFGPGGLRQVFVPDMQRLVDDGVLEVTERRPLHTLTAQVGAEDVPCR